MKKYMLILTSLTIILFSFTLFDANLTVLKGKIIDGQTKEGLIAAEVTLFKNNVLISGTTTDLDGAFEFQHIEPGTYRLDARYLGYQTQSLTGVLVKKGEENIAIIELETGVLMDEVVIKEYKVPLISQDNTTQGKTVSSEEIRSLPSKNISSIAATSAGLAKNKSNGEISIRGSRGNVQNYYVDGIRISPPHPGKDVPLIEYESNESYEEIIENKFIDPLDEALSTFSIDVDRAGYSNVRRYIENGNLPPHDAVRVEEMINYFKYDYPQPKKNDPISLKSNLTDCPWNKEHKLLHISLQGKEIATDELPPSNLVFLIDVSGSMNSANKLPLLKSSFKMLLNKLRTVDKVAIVTYAGRAGVALESTSASQKEKILRVVESLGAGGSTAGAEGIKTAYEIAKSNFIKDGNNRVILATDGDFNVGLSDNDSLEKLIEKQRKSGVFLSILGFGMGNYKDDKMQILAGKGNGNHAYIDNIQESRKVLVEEFGGTLFTIAKDVKIQIEFNPALVQAYKLIGYENLLLNKEDFNDDTKDAGEMGSGHVVTAMYEIVEVGSSSNYAGNIDELKYQENKPRPSAKYSDELATVKFRYKEPDGNKSKKIVSTVDRKSDALDGMSNDIRFSIAVAQFGLQLRQSDSLEETSLNEIIQLAENAKGDDDEGYRSEFVRLVKSVQALNSNLVEN